MLKYIIFKSRITGTIPSFNKIQKTFLEYINAEKKLAKIKESVKEEQENLNKSASSLKTTVGVIKQNEISNLLHVQTVYTNAV